MMHQSYTFSQVNHTSCKEKLLDSSSSSSQYTHPTGSGHHTVWHKVEAEPHLLEHVLEELDDLQRQHVLANVITHLEDARLKGVLVTHYSEVYTLNLCGYNFVLRMMTKSQLHNHILHVKKKCY